MNLVFEKIKNDQDNTNKQKIENTVTPTRRRASQSLKNFISHHLNFKAEEKNSSLEKMIYKKEKNLRNSVLLANPDWINDLQSKFLLKSAQSQKNGKTSQVDKNYQNNFQTNEELVSELTNTLLYQKSQIDKKDFLKILSILCSRLIFTNANFKILQTAYSKLEKRVEGGLQQARNNHKISNRHNFWDQVIDFKEKNYSLLDSLREEARLIDWKIEKITNETRDRLSCLENSFMNDKSKIQNHIKTRTQNFQDQISMSLFRSNNPEQSLFEKQDLEGVSQNMVFRGLNRNLQTSNQMIQNGKNLSPQFSKPKSNMSNHLIGQKKVIQVKITNNQTNKEALKQKLKTQTKINSNNNLGQIISPQIRHNKKRLSLSDLKKLEFPVKSNKTTINSNNSNYKEKIDQKQKELISENFKLTLPNRPSAQVNSAEKQKSTPNPNHSNLEPQNSKKIKNGSQLNENKLESNYLNLKAEKPVEDSNSLKINLTRTIHPKTDFFTPNLLRNNSHGVVNNISVQPQNFQMISNYDIKNPQIRSDLGFYHYNNNNSMISGAQSRLVSLSEPQNFGFEVNNFIGVKRDYNQMQNRNFLNYSKSGLPHSQIKLVKVIL